MKLHTLDQIDPLILKLERAVKQDVAAQDEPECDCPNFRACAHNGGCMQESTVDWIVWDHKEGAPADVQIGHLYEFKFSQNGETVDCGPCSQVNEWSSVYAYRLVNP